MKRTATFLLVVQVLFLAGCTSGKRPSVKGGAVVVAVDGALRSLNPLFTQEIIEGEIAELLYPGLIGSAFDTSKGVLTYTPLLASSWEFQNQHRDLVFRLRTDARWSDGSAVTAKDVQVSYELYGDSNVASVRQVAVERLRRTGGALDISKAVEAVNDSTVVFHFEKQYAGQLFDAGLPILPSYVFEKLQRKTLRTTPLEKLPLVSGPFRLETWTPMQEIILVPNEGSRLPQVAALAKLVFRVLPDYSSRIAHLQSGEVDVVAGVRAEDAQRIESQTPSVRIISVPGRDYDFIGWNNIDPQAYAASQGRRMLPHRLFGSAGVRRALTTAINREEIVAAYLGRHGQVAIGGVSPLFKWAYNDTLRPLAFSRQEAWALLEREGWNDKDGDGVLEKGGQRFAFKLAIPSGNQLLNALALVIQSHLREVMIAVDIELVEQGTLLQQMMDRQFDAVLAGFSVPLQLQLDELWGSDLSKYPFNVTGFRNSRVDQILSLTRNLTDELGGSALWKEFQVILHQQQPCTFLWWKNAVVGVSKRVQSTHIGVLGITHRAWEWNVAD